MATHCAEPLCDACRNPGRCCSGFGLNLPILAEETALDVLIRLARVEHRDCQGRPVVGAPFLPLYRTPERWRFWCPLLGRDGRCTDYEHRPEVCALFKPGGDPLCVMHTPAPPEGEAVLAEKGEA